MNETFLRLRIRAAAVLLTIIAVGFAATMTILFITYPWHTLMFTVGGVAAVVHTIGKQHRHGRRR